MVSTYIPPKGKCKASAAGAQETEVAPLFCTAKQAWISGWRGGSGCRGKREREEVCLVGGAVGETRVRTSGVVKREVASDPGGGRRYRVVPVEIDLLVLEGAPEALDEDVVAPAAATIHADADAVVEQQTGERRTGKLRVPAIRAPRALRPRPSRRDARVAALWVSCPHRRLDPGGRSSLRETPRALLRAESGRAGAADVRPRRQGRDVPLRQVRGARRRHRERRPTGVSGAGARPHLGHGAGHHALLRVVRQSPPGDASPGEAPRRLCARADRDRAEP